jgi:RHS repeat-associated protein
MKVGGNYYFYQNDHLGTPQKLTAVNGAIIWSAKYSSFGETEVDTSSSITNNLRFPGQYYDQETGLHYNYLRYYDPIIGRYIRNDPIGFIGGVNMFVYVQNSPVKFIDPLGLKEICIPAVSNKTEWEFHQIGKPEWELASQDVQTTDIHAGTVGICYWRKVERGYKTRVVTPVKLCFDTCEGNIYYKFEYSKQKKLYEDDEREIAYDQNFAKWIPQESAFWIPICEHEKY